MTVTMTAHPAMSALDTGSSGLHQRVKKKLDFLVTIRHIRVLDAVQLRQKRKIL